MPIEAESPWYLEVPELAIEPDRPLVEPYIAPPGSHEFALLQSYDGIRQEIVAPGRPAENKLKRRRLLEQAIGLAIQFHGKPLLAAGLLAISTGGETEVLRAPTHQSPMARLGASNAQNKAKAKAKAEPKPPREKALPAYTPPVVIREGDITTTARPIKGMVVWSVGTLEQILGPRCVSAALARARGKIPMMEHARLFPRLRARVGAKTVPVSCVSLEGLRALSQFIPAGSKAGQALAEYLGG